MVRVVGRGTHGCTAARDGRGEEDLWTLLKGEIGTTCREALSRFKSSVAVPVRWILPVESNLIFARLVETEAGPPAYRCHLCELRQEPKYAVAAPVTITSLQKC